MAKLTTTSDVQAFTLELARGTRWQGNKIGGGPVPGIDGLNLGLLPEPYHAAAGEAVYAVYHYETPIVWQIADGTWQVPDHFYGRWTSAFRNKITQALETNGATVISI